MVQAKLHSVFDETFQLCPKALQDVCLKCVGDNLPSLTSYEIKDVDNACKKETKFCQDVSISSRVAEKLLTQISGNSLLRNDTLCIFKGPEYNLKALKLPEIHMDLCGQELLNYSAFNFRELELGCPNRINRWSVKKLSQSFAGSCQSLVYLKINVYPAVDITSGTIFDFFVQFPNLQSLYYDSPIQKNALTFTNNNWNSLMVLCPQLRVLHININGSSKDTELDSQIFNKAVNLRSLSLYCALKSEVAVHSSSCVLYFLKMDNLRELDLSVDVEPPESLHVVANIGELEEESHIDLLAKHVNRFLKESENHLPLLESLDLSGIHHINDSLIQRFLDTHSALRFLGLCLLQSKFCVNMDIAKSYENIKISGCVLENQIVMSLLKYATRMSYMKEVLKGLFQVSSGWDKRRPHILKIVLEVMERFKGHMQLQMAATACVFHLAKEPDGEKPDLPVFLLSEIARVTSMILVMYVGNLQMVKNCLLIICTDRILHQADFDRVAMSRLCLNCMLSYHEDRDRHVTRMAVAIVSILACKISSKDTSNLMQDREMKLLLDIVERRLQQKTVDGTLKFDLSALWNLTDESPQACQLFVDLDGLNKYIRLLEVFKADMHIETKVLGLLNNIAEVEFLHDKMLLDENLMKQVRLLISNEQAQVSYFACGIIANLALRWDDLRTVLDSNEKEGILTEMDVAIQRWGALQGEIVTYRSFKPFHGLLQCHDKPQIQRWAIWAIHHVCSLSANHYKDLMTHECLTLIENVRLKSTSPDVCQQCEDIYEKVRKRPVVSRIKEYFTEQPKK